jgi:hypothetical protein
MKGVILPNLKLNHLKSSQKSLFLTYFLAPAKSGMFGFAIFFTVLLIVKAFSIIFSNNSFFIIKTEDVALSLIGFVSFYLVKIFKQILAGK